MAEDLHRPIARALSPSVVGLLARTLGERTDAVRTGMSAALVAVFRASGAKAATEAGAGEVLSVVREAHAANVGLLGGLEPQLRSPGAGGLLAERSAAVDRLFSGRAPGVAAHLASFAKVKAGSAATLLAFATQLVLAALDEAGAVTGGPAGLRKLLRAQEGEVRRITPAGFEPDVGGAPAGASGGAGRWLPWLLAGLALLALLLVLFGGLRSRGDEDAPGATVVTAPPAAVATPGAAGQPVVTERVTLPDGRPLELDRAGLNFALQSYLASDAPAGRTFTFDALQYETGSSRLRPEGERTLESLAAILLAYPKTVVRLEGHTDEAGDPANNQRLSAARAAETADALAVYGVAAERLTAQGFGETRPIAANDSRGRRALNRRTDLVVVRK